MALIEQPWARVNDPVAIPLPTTVATLTSLDDVGFAQLLRDHLVPREPAGTARTRWETLWQVLTSDDALADRAFDVLEEFLDDVDDALSAVELDERSRKRMTKFRRFCDDAWKRLKLHHDRPLGWAGRAGAGFNPVGRKVISQLVDAIAQHRHALQDHRAVRPEDEVLWGALALVGLDPAGASDRQRR